MLSASVDDPVLGDVLTHLDAGKLQKLLRAGLPDAGDGPGVIVPLDTLYHPGRYVRRSFAVVRSADTPLSRVWPEGELFYVHFPARQPMSRRGRICRAESTEVELYRFPNDRRLRGLRRFAATKLAPQIWQPWLEQATPGARLNPATLQRRFVRYSPEYKWIVRLRAEVELPGAKDRVKRRIAVRCAAPKSCRQLAERHLAVAAALSGCENVRVPALIGVRDDLGVVAVEWDRGDPFIDCLKADDTMIDRFAHALGAFHAMSVPGLPLQTPEGLCTASRDAGVELGLVVPELAGDLGGLSVELSRRLIQSDVPAAGVLHNDLHLKQVHVRRGRMTFLDLERMALGDPLMDVANLAVQLAMLPDQPGWQIDRAQADRWIARFLAAWACRTGQSLDPRRFRPYCAASFLRFAHGRMRHLRPGWRQTVRACVESADKQLSDNRSLEAIR